MQERTRMRQSMWCSAGTLLNPKAILPVMFCTAGVLTSGRVSCCDVFDVKICPWSTVSNVQANEEMFLEDCCIIASVSFISFEFRFLFLILSDGGVFFWGIIVGAIVFSTLADALSDEIDELFETSAADKHQSSESIVEDSLSSSLVNSDDSQNQNQ